MATRFYLDGRLTLGSIRLDGPQAHHLANVCRFRPGDVVTLFNGDGEEYRAVVESCSKREVVLTITAVSRPAREHPALVEVACAWPKGDRADYLLEKLTELGVSRFVPLRTQRSVVEPRDGKLERLQRLVIEASKQCGRCVLLEISPIRAWEDYLRAAEAIPQRRIVHPGPEANPQEGRTGRPEAIKRSVGLTVAIGPEGGFTEEEIDQAEASGFVVCNLGPRILRVETAAIAAVAMLTLSD